MAKDHCCSAGTWPQPPNRVPYSMCDDGRQGTTRVYVNPQAAILLGRFGVDPCNVPHPGDEVRLVDAENYLREHGYIT